MTAVSITYFTKHYGASPVITSVVVKPAVPLSNAVEVIPPVSVGTVGASTVHVGVGTSAGGVSVGNGVLVGTGVAVGTSTTVVAVGGTATGGVSVGDGNGTGVSIVAVAVGSGSSGTGPAGITKRRTRASRSAPA